MQTRREPRTVRPSAGVHSRTTDSHRPTVAQKLQEAARLNTQELEAANQDAILSPADRKPRPASTVSGQAARKAAGRVIVWRFYNPVNGGSLLHSQRSERDAVRFNRALRHLQYEGPAFETDNQASRRPEPGVQVLQRH